MRGSHVRCCNLVAISSLPSSGVEDNTVAAAAAIHGEERTEEMRR